MEFETKTNTNMGTKTNTDTSTKTNTNKNTKTNTKTRGNFFLGKINFRGFFAHTKTITFWYIALF